MGQAIANRMESKLRAVRQTAQALSDGINLMQTAEGGLDSINALLHSENALAVQAASETLNDSDRQAVSNHTSSFAKKSTA